MEREEIGGGGEGREKRGRGRGEASKVNEDVRQVRSYPAYPASPTPPHRPHTESPAMAFGRQHRTYLVVGRECDAIRPAHAVLEEHRRGAAFRAKENRTLRCAPVLPTEIYSAVLSQGQIVRDPHRLHGGCGTPERGVLCRHIQRHHLALADVGEGDRLPILAPPHTIEDSACLASEEHLRHGIAGCQ